MAEEKLLGKKKTILFPPLLTVASSGQASAEWKTYDLMLNVLWSFITWIYSFSFEKFQTLQTY